MKRMFGVSAVLAFCSLVFAQTVSAPPMKMGLWEITTVSKMKLNLPPEVMAHLPGMGPQTFVSQVCMTPETWRDAYTKSQKNNKDCQYTNLKQDASGMSADVVCHSGKGTSTGHMQLTFVSMERTQGTMHMEMTDGKNPQPTIMDMTFDSVFRGDDCKGLAPGAAKLVR
ncbi:MAG: DUF3617 domain-containing protein [Acidobacteriaceae bacterium]|nr:DUF3617 domain-containing protein [Acidobacteriaceae bacterium]